MSQVENFKPLTFRNAPRTIAQWIASGPTGRSLDANGETLTPKNLPSESSCIYFITLHSPVAAVSILIFSSFQSLFVFFVLWMFFLIFFCLGVESWASGFDFPEEVLQLQRHLWSRHQVQTPWLPTGGRPSDQLKAVWEVKEKWYFCKPRSSKWC